MNPRLCAISIDLDEVPHYFALHGLNPPSGPTAELVYRLGLRRAVGLGESLGLPLTLFVIGADLQGENIEALRALLARGHEIANHSHDHYYDLLRRSPEEVRDQVAKGISALKRELGVTPTGFRAPGYAVSDVLFGALETLGTGYDSSVFPCPVYYAVKALAMIAIHATGRQSGAVLHPLTSLYAPTEPYRMGRPFWRRGSGLVELPIQVTPRLRLPVIGTTLSLLGPDRSRTLLGGLLDKPFINLVLHGMDFLDSSDGLEELVRYQPDLRVPVLRKLDSFCAVVEQLRGAGYSFVRLDEAARRTA